jgi:hypothetical protein
MRTTVRFAVVATVALASGCASKIACKGPLPTDAPAAAVYVSICGDDGNDGTLERPFRTLPRAIASGAPFVAVGEGAYEPPVAPIDRSLTVRGLGADRTRIAASGASSGVPRAVFEVSGPVTVALEAFAISGQARSGVVVSSGALDLRRMRVEGVADPSPQAIGHGVVALDASVVAEALEVRANRGWGIVATRSSLTLRDSVVASNGGGGVASVGVPVVGGTVIERGDVVANTEAGVAAFGATVRLVGATVEGTVARGSSGGDGVLAVALLGEGGRETASQIDVLDARVRRNARAGVLVAGGARGSLAGGLIGENGRAGLWVQGGRGAAPFAVSGVTFDGNVGSGVVATSGASIAFTSSTVTGTRGLGVIEGLGSVTIGDGLSVFDGASATVTGSTFGPSARVAVIVDAAAASTTFANNRVTMTGDAVVLQGGAGVAFGATENTLASGARVVDAGAGRALATVRGAIAVTAAP